MFNSKYQLEVEANLEEEAVALHQQRLTRVRREREAIENNLAIEQEILDRKTKQVFRETYNMLY